MKAKHGLVLLIFGFCLDFLGSFFKILHRQGADSLITLAVVIKISGALILLYKLLAYPKWKDFLNS